MYHIFGHTAPDTDAFVSAFALAYWFNAQGIAACAYRLGNPNLETQFVLDYLHQHYHLPTLRADLLPYLDPKNPFDTLSKGDQIALTDHNEATQSIAHLTDFKIAYVIDHHKIALNTPTPAYVRIAPVGCTCTILYQMFKEQHITIPAHLAYLMLTAILSDTSALQSPTTTAQDKAVANSLGQLCQLTQIDDFAQAMFVAKSQLTNLSADEILTTDYKAYQFGHHKWGIAGIETTMPTQLFDRKQELANTATRIKAQKGLDYLMIAVVDIGKQTGYALAYDPAQNAILEQAFLAKAHQEWFVLEGVVSRKQQIVPALQQFYDNRP